MSPLDATFDILQFPAGGSAPFCFSPTLSVSGNAALAHGLQNPA
jgi:hypothetical protein